MKLNIAQEGQVEIGQDWSYKMDIKVLING